MTTSDADRELVELSALVKVAAIGAVFVALTMLEVPRYFPVLPEIVGYALSGIVAAAALVLFAVAWVVDKEAKR